jgi:hypothetical protein
MIGFFKGAYVIFFEWVYAERIDINESTIVGRKNVTIEDIKMKFVKYLIIKSKD